MRRLLPASLFLLSACGIEPACDTQVLQVARDIGSDRYAATEVRSCGATTGFATIVRVGRASEPQSDAVEVFVADSDHGKANAGMDGSIFMNVVWTAPGKLAIVHDARGRVFKRVAEAKGAQLTYRASRGPSLPPGPPRPDENFDWLRRTN